MAFERMVTVNVTLSTTSVTRANFGTLIFIGAHNYFKERQRIYSSLDAVGADFPTTSDEYIAAQSAFSGSPRIANIKIGRRENDLLTLTPEPITAIGQQVSVTVVGTDGVSVDAVFTSAAGNEDAATVVADLAGDLSGIVGVTVGGTTTLTLAEAVQGVAFSIADPEGFDSVVSTATELPADTLTEISKESDDYYFVTAHDHTQSYVEAMAAAIETKRKQYWYSLADTQALLAPVQPPVGTGEKLEDTGYLRTYGWFHDEADTLFVETHYVALMAIYDPGTIVIANNQVFVGGIARDPANQLPLDDTQLNNLNAKNLSVVIEDGGVNVTNAQGGLSASGEWTDVVRDMDFIQARLEEATKKFMISQNKIAFTNFGIASLESVVINELNKYVETETTTNILEAEKPYELFFPDASEFTAQDKALRKFTWSANLYLAGAIQITVANITIGYREGE